MKDSWLTLVERPCTIRTQADLKSRGFCMDIAEVAKRSGLTAATLRFYEEKGLIRSSGRVGLRRRFDPRVLDQLALIGLGQAAGFTLEQIGHMFDPGGGTSIDRKLLSAKADEIDALVARLQSVSKGLRHAAVCPAPSHGECPNFQRLLRATARKAGWRKWPAAALR
jgi:DNA-binding transcriptional MerR regulator